MRNGDPRGGILTNRSDFLQLCPADIMFITAREDNVEAARTKAAERGAVLWQFGHGDEWKSYLRGRLKYLMTRLGRTLDGYPVDIAS